MASMGRIALDLDGVVTDIGASIKSNAPRITHKGVANCLFNKSGSKSHEHIFNNNDFWLGLHAVKDSWHQINHWFNMGYDIYFVTARRTDDSIGAIEEWLAKWRLGYTTYFVTDMFDKLSILDKIDPIVFVDDNPFEIEKIKNAKKSNMDVFLMKTWYNQHIAGDLPSISSLLEIKIG